VLAVVACMLAALAFTSAALADAPAPLRKIVVIGASVSDGFGVRLRTQQEDGRQPVVGVNVANLLQAAAREPGMQVVSHASSGYFSDPVRFARESVRKTTEDAPTLVLAIDWMFWNAYGLRGRDSKRLQTCVDRLALLESACATLQPLAESGVPIVLGDLPDMQLAVEGGMLNQAMIPDAECLRRLNEQLRTWAARYPNIALLDLAALVRNVLDKKPVRACNRDWCETDLGPLLQRDRLHPTLNGTLAVVAASLDAADRRTDGAASRAFDLNPATIRERVSKQAAQRVDASARDGAPVTTPSAAPPAPPAAAGSGSTPSPSAARRGRVRRHRRWTWGRKVAASPCWATWSVPHARTG
jgi:hypothetical protein